MDRGSWIRDDGWLNLMQRSHAITGKSLLLNHVAKEEALQQQSSFSFLDDTKAYRSPVDEAVVVGASKHRQKSVHDQSRGQSLYENPRTQLEKRDLLIELARMPGTTPAHIQGFIALENNQVFHVLQSSVTLL